jgi:hypothetical protein
MTLPIAALTVVKYVAIQKDILAPEDDRQQEGISTAIRATVVYPPVATSYIAEASRFAPVGAARETAAIIKQWLVRERDPAHRGDAKSARGSGREAPMLRSNPVHGVLRVHR